MKIKINAPVEAILRGVRITAEPGTVFDVAKSDMVHLCGDLKVDNIPFQAQKIQAAKPKPEPKAEKKAEDSKEKKKSKGKKSS